MKSEAQTTLSKSLMAASSSPSAAVSASPWSMASLRTALRSVPSPRVRSLRHHGYGPASEKRGACGLSSGFCSRDSSSLYRLRFEQGFSYINSGSKFYAMRHRKCVPKLTGLQISRKLCHIALQHSC